MICRTGETRVCPPAAVFRDKLIPGKGIICAAKTALATIKPVSGHGHTA